MQDGLRGLLGLTLNLDAMVILREFDFLISDGKGSQNYGNSTSPLFGLVDLSLYHTCFYNLQSFSLSFWCFLLYQPFSNDSKVKAEEQKVRNFKRSMVPRSFQNCFEEQEPSLEEVKQDFDVFDENKDGFIDDEELQRVLCILGLKEAAKLENCHKMIRIFDTNQDGRIYFIEFVKIMENCFR
ncbi:putative calcium-binding protein CML46 [Glycine soja]|uniref:Putative calcium-binding protein CML46 n=1 Tax=Glycine soja TaxID=3848 RepID=A0A445H6X3_GLYSO|nr:putative calcium-binding protein CML46 [Glycine soja]